MDRRVLGLHHVTATVDDAQADLDFCLDLLGLRLVKKTVNFDNHFVYHFYYGNEGGEPGTIWTTFPYKGKGVRVGTKGAGQVVTTSFSVPAPALDWWRERLRVAGVSTADVGDRFGEPAVAFSDPSGLRFELIASSREVRAPWSAPGIPPECAIRGLHSVTLLVRKAEATVQFMSRVLGFTAHARAGSRVRLHAGENGPGRTIDVVEDAAAPLAVNGLGTVHHVAMAIGTAEEQTELREVLLGLGYGVTEVRDRCYFTSIYFREPGGVLFEVATITPGFTVDEELTDLGRALKLPPWEEPHRASIEAHLTPVRY
jgi:glyoxalase family protein